MDADQSKWALRTLLETVKRPYPDSVDSQVSDLDHWLGAWYRFNFYMAKEESRLELNARMSLKQRETYRLLYEWWTAAYQDPAYSLAEILHHTSSLGDLSETNPAYEGQREENWSLVFQHLRLKRWPNGPIPKPECDESVWVAGRSYNVLMNSLLRLEFMGGPGNRNAENLATTHYRLYFREQGVKFAYCQEIGYKLYLQAHPLEDSGKVVHPSPDNVSAAHPILTRGSVFEPCPWLERDKGEEHGNLPLYLWDVTKGETVLSAALQNRPEYSAISHTWGRWIQDEANPVDIPGARWKIPRNTRFDVTNLPQLLRSVPCGTPYIWLDLLCIPQYASAEQAREIGRQAKIFQSAKYVVAWLNDVENFDGLRFITQWQALKLLNLPTRLQEDLCQEQTDEVSRNVYGKQLGLMSTPSAALSTPINAWFTSLWTLQEAAMRPDMWLCSRDWKPLTWDGHSPLPLSGFIAVLSVFRTMLSGTRSPNPMGVVFQQLLQWSYHSGLEMLLHLDRTSLIMLGDRRECTGRRAEAIMSALGVTSWYKEALRSSRASTSDGHVANLVLGKYPRRFVQECASKFPGEFFGLIMKVKLNEQPGLFTERHGTLLPFSRGIVYYINPDMPWLSANPMESHESLRTWTVLASGSVRIQRACVLCSSQAGSTISAKLAHFLARLRARLPHSLRASAIAYPAEEESLKVYDSLQILQNHLEDPKIELHAILTQFYFMEHDGRRALVAYGIILQRSQWGRLRKKCTFSLTNGLGLVDVLKTKRVSWVID